MRPLGKRLYSTQTRTTEAKVSIVPLLRDHPQGHVKGLSKEMVSDKGEVSMRHTTAVTSKADLTKEVAFHMQEWSLKRGSTVHVHIIIILYILCVIQH